MTLIPYLKEQASVAKATANFLFAGLLPKLQVPDVLLTGKRAIVTGANSGIGFEAARHLAAQGAEVWLFCRTLKKGEEAAIQIRKATGNERVFYEAVDFSSLEQVRGLVEAWSNKPPEERKIDVLLNNAGVSATSKYTTAEGFELTYVVNFLSQFLMTTLLLNLGAFASDARIVQVSSFGLYQAGRLNPNDLNSTDMLGHLQEGAALGMKFLPLYGRGKAQQVVWTRDLQERLAKTERYKDVVVAVCHPGTIWSPMWHQPTSIGGLTECTKHMLWKVEHIAISVEEGAKTPLYCCLAPDLVGGKYWDRNKWRWTPGWMEDAALRRALWARWEEDLGIEASGY